MPRLTWAPSAQRDLARLRAFLAAKNPDAARRAIVAILAGVDVIAEHPEVGRSVAGMGLKFREWVVGFGDGAYIAFYRRDDGDVVILAVRHGREASYWDD